MVRVNETRMRKPRVRERAHGLPCERRSTPSHPCRTSSPTPWWLIWREAALRSVRVSVRGKRRACATAGRLPCRRTRQSMGEYRPGVTSPHTPYPPRRAPRHPLTLAGPVRRPRAPVLCAQALLLHRKRTYRRPSYPLPLPPPPTTPALCVPTRFLSVAPATSFHVILFPRCASPCRLRFPPPGPLSSPSPSRRRASPRFAHSDCRTCALCPSLRYSRVFRQSRSRLFARTELHAELALYLVLAPYRPLTLPRCDHRSCPVPPFSLLFLSFSPSLSLFLFVVVFLLIFAVSRIFLGYYYAQIGLPRSTSNGALHASLVSYMSSNFFATCSPSLPLISSHPLFLSLSLSSPPREPACLLSPNRDSPELDFPPVSLTYYLLQSLALHLRVSAVAWIPIRPHDDGSRLVRAFFSTAGRIFATRKSGFLCGLSVIRAFTFFWSTRQSGRLFLPP